MPGCREKVGPIIIRVTKNDVRARTLKIKVFKRKWTLLHAVYSTSRTECTFPIPFIRMVFALHGNVPGVSLKTYKSASKGAASLDDKGQRPRLCFTSYDFWCSGTDPNILLPRTKPLNIGGID